MKYTDGISERYVVFLLISSFSMSSMYHVIHTRYKWQSHEMGFFYSPFPPSNLFYIMFFGTFSHSNSVIEHSFLRNQPDLLIKIRIDQLLFKSWNSLLMSTLGLIFPNISTRYILSYKANFWDSNHRDSEWHLLTCFKGPLNYHIKS